jgi:hypothetical protein
MTTLGGAVAPLAAAQPSPAPATQPRGGGGDRRFERGGGGGGGGDGMRQYRGGGGEWARPDARPDSPNFVEASDEEWKDVEAFMREYSPKRFDRMKDIASDDRLTGVRNTMTARYRMLQDLKERDPELFQIRAERMKIEDDLFALRWDQSQGERPGDVRAAQREGWRRMVKSSLKERALHLHRAEQKLAQTRQELKEDEDDKRIEAAVDAKMKDLDDDRWPRDLRGPRKPPQSEPVNAAPAETKRQ